uniref:Putative secreted peptide n=1 Tax=Anopheles braziliensis TaxID=58242 RepID=A0A2M3ZSH1_9DIPT
MRFPLALQLLHLLSGGHNDRFQFGNVNLRILQQNMCPFLDLLFLPKAFNRLLDAFRFLLDRFTLGP